MHAQRFFQALLTLLRIAELLGEQCALHFRILLPKRVHRSRWNHDYAMVKGSPHLGSALRAWFTVEKRFVGSPKRIGVRKEADRVDR